MKAKKQSKGTLQLQMEVLPQSLRATTARAVSRDDMALTYREPGSPPPEGHLDGMDLLPCYAPIITGCLQRIADALEAIAARRPLTAESAD